MTFTSARPQVYSRAVDSGALRGFVEARAGEGHGFLLLTGHDVGKTGAISGEPWTVRPCSCPLIVLYGESRVE